MIAHLVGQAFNLPNSFGKVMQTDFNGTEHKAVIKFDGIGDKTLLLSFAKLRILE